MAPRVEKERLSSGDTCAKRLFVTKEKEVNKAECKSLVNEMTNKLQS